MNFNWVYFVRSKDIFIKFCLLFFTKKLMYNLYLNYEYYFDSEWLVHYYSEMKTIFFFLILHKTNRRINPMCQHRDLVYEEIAEFYCSPLLYHMLLKKMSSMLFFSQFYFPVFILIRVWCMKFTVILEGRVKKTIICMSDNTSHSWHYTSTISFIKTISLRKKVYIGKGKSNLFKYWRHLLHSFLHRKNYDASCICKSSSFNNIKY